MSFSLSSGDIDDSYTLQLHTLEVFVLFLYVVNQQVRIVNLYKIVNKNKISVVLHFVLGRPLITNKKAAEFKVIILPRSLRVTLE